MGRIRSGIQEQVAASGNEEVKKRYEYMTKAKAVAEQGQKDLLDPKYAGLELVDFVTSGGLVSQILKKDALKSISKYWRNKDIKIMDKEGQIWGRYSDEELINRGSKDRIGKGGLVKGKDIYSMNQSGSELFANRERAKRQMQTVQAIPQKEWDRVKNFEIDPSMHNRGARGEHYPRGTGEDEYSDILIRPDVKQQTIIHEVIHARELDAKKAGAVKDAPRTQVAKERMNRKLSDKAHDAGVYDDLYDDLPSENVARHTSLDLTETKLPDVDGFPQSKSRVRSRRDPISQEEWDAVYAKNVHRSYAEAEKKFMKEMKSEQSMITFQTLNDRSRLDAVKKGMKEGSKEYTNYMLEQMGYNSDVATRASQLQQTRIKREFARPEHLESVQKVIPKTF